MPVYVPKSAYKAVFKANFRGNESLTLIGNVPSQIHTFEVNFINSNTGDIHFHVKPRFRDRKISRNYKKNNTWSKEFEDNTPKFGFEQGKEFTMEVRNEGDAFAVFVNGEKLFSYKHRLPFNQIDIIEIKDIGVTLVKL
ncbi:32 kDa beta-galactoside-binding lectin-like [Dendropsophus ebraccatus]|uniref:32 kDa beta-galactoside-binding lectin-like n=1 Tax=Dendropsophus ebraccatus TaxID=150705 RepID=UPI003831EF22